jgi:hypothetical protein
MTIATASPTMVVFLAQPTPNALEMAYASTVFATQTHNVPPIRIAPPIRSANKELVATASSIPPIAQQDKFARMIHKKAITSVKPSNVQSPPIAALDSSAKTSNASAAIPMPPMNAVGKRSAYKIDAIMPAYKTKTAPPPPHNAVHLSLNIPASQSPIPRSAFHAVTPQVIVHKASSVPHKLAFST